jgi:hypothetical protein
MSLHCGSGLRYNGRDIAPGAQTERPGGLGPVRTLLGGYPSPAAFLLSFGPGAVGRPRQDGSRYITWSVSASGSPRAP